MFREHVCVRLRACVRACVFTRLCVCVCVCTRLLVCARVLVYAFVHVQGVWAQCDVCLHVILPFHSTSIQLSGMPVHA